MPNRQSDVYIKEDVCMIATKLLFALILLNIFTLLPTIMLPAIGVGIGIVKETAMIAQQNQMVRQVVRGVALVGALLISGQVVAGGNLAPRECCDRGCSQRCGGPALAYPEMWQARSEVNWANVHTFHRPAWQNVRLDFCYKDGMYCGRAAANQFCRANGFRYSTQFEIDRGVGQTRNIATGYVNYSDCRDGFRYIRCRN